MLNRVRRISDLHRSERRQTSAHHEQCCVEKGIEEPWTIERGSPFIDLLGYRDITPKTDMGPAIIAFRSCVADLCKAVQKSPQRTQ